MQAPSWEHQVSLDKNMDVIVILELKEGCNEENIFKFSLLCGFDVLTLALLPRWFLRPLK